MTALLITICVGPDRPRGEVRARTTHRHIEGVRRFQRLLERFGVVPSYLLGFPALLQGEDAWFAELHQRDACELGVYFEPWSTPPFGANENRLSARTLAETQQSVIGAKLQRLTETFEERFGFRPRSHRSAGYGLTGSALQALEGLDYLVDSSILSLQPSQDPLCADARYSPQGPYFPDRQRPRTRGGARVLEVPVSMGWPTRAGRLLARFAGAKRVQPTILDPAACDLDAMRSLSEHLMAAVYPALIVHVDSNILYPGCSASCPNSEDVDKVFECLDQFLRYAVDEARAQPRGLLDFAEKFLG